MGQQIHWFPGHMSKALNEVENKVKLVDVIIELFDARAPMSSVNENLEKLTTNKKKLIVLTKIDLADPEQSKKWLEELKKKYLEQIPAGRFGEPVDVANACVFLASDEASYINGQTIHINGGMVRF